MFCFVFVYPKLALDDFHLFLKLHHIFSPFCFPNLSFLLKEIVYFLLLMKSWNDICVLYHLFFFSKFSLFMLKTFSSFHCPHVLRSICAFWMSSNLCCYFLFDIVLTVFCNCHFYKFVFLGNFTLLNAYCLDCPSIFFVIPFLCSYLQNLSLLFVLL